MFEGIKNSKYARLSITLSLIRKLVFVIVIVFSEDIKREGVFSILLVMQAAILAHC